MIYRGGHKNDRPFHRLKQAHDMLSQNSIGVSDLYRNSRCDRQREIDDDVRYYGTYQIPRLTSSHSPTTTCGSATIQIKIV